MVITLFIGIAGTTMSVMGILDRFVDFLNLLGVLFPPVIGVMMVDYFILKSDRKVLDESRRRNALPDEAQTKKLRLECHHRQSGGRGSGVLREVRRASAEFNIAGCLMYLLLSFVKGLMTSQHRQEYPGTDSGNIH